MCASDHTVKEKNAFVPCRGYVPSLIFSCFKRSFSPPQRARENLRPGPEAIRSIEVLFPSAGGELQGARAAAQKSRCCHCAIACCTNGLRQYSSASESRGKPLEAYCVLAKNRALLSAWCWKLVATRSMRRAPQMTSKSIARAGF